jgi:MFS family permease
MLKAQARFYGWINLVGLMLVYGSLCGNITYAYGVFLPAMGESFDWSRSALSGPYTLFFIIGGLLGPAAGVTNARFGPRKNIIIFNLLAAAGLFGMSKIGAIWQVYLYFGVIIGTVIAFGEFIPVTSVVNNWFVRKRSLAMGLLFASGGIGGFVMPPVISWLVGAYGWPRAWQWLAGFHFLTAVVVGGLLIRNKPEDIGQRPDGVEPAEPRSVPDPPAGQAHPASRDWHVGEALRSAPLWMIVALFSIILFTTNILSTHQVAYLQDLGFSPIASATALGMMLGFSIFGRLLCGMLGMRYDGRRLAVFFLACIGAGILFLMHAGSIHSIYGYSILTGVGFGGMIVLVPHLLGTYFGRTNYVRIIGWTAPVVTFASAAGPVLAGALYDATKKYDGLFAIMIVLIASGAAIGALMPPPSGKAAAPDAAESRS